LERRAIGLGRRTRALAGSISGGRRSLRSGRKVSQGSGIELATLGYAYGIAGQKEEAKKIVEQLKTKKKSEYISDFYFGHVYAGLGQNDLAFEFLMKACSNWQGDWGMLFINAPYSDSIREDPRFEELVRCMKLQS
jgi:tetratricopeptide (TPR) repeat protein